MIIFREAHDKLAAMHIAQVFDRHELCVVSMVPVSEPKDDGILGGTIFSPATCKNTWLVVGQAAEMDISAIDRDIQVAEKGPRSIVEDLNEIDEIIADAEKENGPGPQKAH